MKKRTLFILLTCFVLVHAMAQYPSFLKKKTLKNLTNQKIALNQITENKPFVLVFYTTECPICQKYVPILRGVSEAFPDVKFIFVFTKWDSLQAINDFSKESIDGVTQSHPVNNHEITQSPNHPITKSPNHKITQSPNHKITQSPNHKITQSQNHKITVLWDSKHKLVKKTRALTTPEAFFYNNKGQLQYRGAIDNWFYALGQYRPEATEHYLKNALTQFSKNEQITLSETKPIGCYIEY